MSLLFTNRMVYLEATVGVILVFWYITAMSITILPQYSTCRMMKFCQEQEVPTIFPVPVLLDEILRTLGLPKSWFPSPPNSSPA